MKFDRINLLENGNIKIYLTGISSRDDGWLKVAQIVSDDGLSRWCIGSSRSAIEQPICRKS
jgi:hypothetical protein